MLSIFGLIVNIISMLAAVFTAVLAFIAAKRYVFKESYYGNTADEEFLKLGLDINSFQSKPYEGGNNRKFPSLKIEKKWGSVSKVTYYTNDNNEKLEKTWYKKGS